MGAVGAAAPTDFWNGAFAPTLFIKNSISLLIKLTIEFKNLKSAPTDLEILTRALFKVEENIIKNIDLVLFDKKLHKNDVSLN